MKKTVLIIGAGPAGLTAAAELLRHGGFNPIVVEKSPDIGGLSKTVTYKGNKIDIGGHRFFSKSDIVMDWWANVLPLQRVEDESDAGPGGIAIKYHGKDRSVASGNIDPENADDVMLIRSRLSRIYHSQTFFSYPISLSWQTIQGLGFFRMMKIGFSYLRSMLFPIRPELTLEDFFINRFGRELYKTFFKDYTEKVWGEPCNQIPAEWGAQRVKGLSIAKAIKQFFTKSFSGLLGKTNSDLRQKNTETSLIERFLYPKFGPGHLWERVASDIEAQGGTIIKECDINQIAVDPATNAIVGASGTNADGSRRTFTCDYLISTMPVRELILSLGDAVPSEIHDIAAGLRYRDFITVGVLLKQLSPAVSRGGALNDNWIYIQEPYVKVGRIQIFNNWSPYLVKDPETVWIGMEYFANVGDDLWTMEDEAFKQFAFNELEALSFAHGDDVLDAVVIRMEKAYPSYTGQAYGQFETLRTYTDAIPNLFLIGRNGMHRYNNQDHSMLTAMEAVRCIVENQTDKAGIWAVNTEEDYHESK